MAEFHERRSNCISTYDSLAFDLLERGWAVVYLAEDSLNESEELALSNWEDVFAAAFSLPTQEKVASGVYRTECGVSVGYRVDSEREFFESRIRSEGVPEPNFPQVADYTRTVQSLYSALNKVAQPAMTAISESMGIDRQVFFDLTDLETDGVLAPITKTSPDGEAVETSSNLSSTLLRICKYQDDVTTGTASGKISQQSTRNLWFGAHTDSSLLTLSLCSSTPGLDIVDQLENRWVAPEVMVRRQGEDEQKGEPRGENSEFDSSHSSRHKVIIFVGEFLQVISKHRYKAAVHRVRNLGDVGPFSPHVDHETRGVIPITRISCPYLIRGRHGAVFDIHNAEKYNHPGGEDAVSEENMPNLDGTSVKIMHKLLDLKRQRCFRENGSAEGSDWVLSAYPVPPLPVEN